MRPLIVANVPLPSVLENLSEASQRGVVPGLPVPSCCRARRPGSEEDALDRS